MQQPVLLTVLAVPDCPNLGLMMDRLREALPDMVGGAVVHLVNDETQAAALGMCGSPTLLVDGVDPFRSADALPSMSCRLYRMPDGGLSGAPSVEQLQAALPKWK
jgi:hypothetical protein